MRTTVSIPDDLSEHVDAVRASDDDSDAEAVRQCIQRSQRLKNCQTEREQLEDDIDRLQQEKQMILEQRDEHTELVRQVERQQSIEQKRAEAGLITRAKWFLTGMDSEKQRS